MPCYSPLSAYRAAESNPSGKRSLIFSAKREIGSIEIPCGQCIGCRLDYSRQWAVRGTHELQMHTESSFLTLTYNDDNIPMYDSLVKSHPQKFLKRYRKHISPTKIRYMLCGEYGDATNRPHYHAIIYGHDFSDKEYYKSNFNGDSLYTSPTLSSLWPYGHAVIGSVTFDSIAYVARYTVKKVRGAAAVEHYGDRIPEFMHVSNRPGIGESWYRKYRNDLKFDYVIHQGKKLSVPAYYDKLRERESAEELELIKEQRKLKAKEFAHDNTPGRLRVKEYVKRAKITKLTRSTD